MNIIVHKKCDINRYPVNVPKKKLNRKAKRIDMG